MARTIVLLRGINVSGKNKVPMAGLRTALTRAGFEGVATYIQSGNIAVDTELNFEKLSATIGALLTDNFDVSVPVVCVTQRDIEDLEARHPFPDDADPATHMIYFPKGPVDVDGIAAMDLTKYPSDTIEASTDAVYVGYGNGQSKTKLTLAALEKAAGTSLTGRNLRSVAKLRDL